MQMQENPESIDNLRERARSGDLSAGVEWLELQREGKGLRFYPDGRRGPGDDGVVAFAVQVRNTTQGRRWAFVAGRPVRVSEMPLATAQELAATILRECPGNEFPPCPMGLTFDRDVVWLTMPEVGLECELSDGEARSLAALVLYFTGNR